MESNDKKPDNITAGLDEQPVQRFSYEARAHLLEDMPQPEIDASVRSSTDYAIPGERRPIEVSVQTDSERLAEQLSPQPNDLEPAASTTEAAVEPVLPLDTAEEIASGSPSTQETPADQSHDSTEANTETSLDTSGRAVESAPPEPTSSTPPAPELQPTDSPDKDVVAATDDKHLIPARLGRVRSHRWFLPITIGVCVLFIISIIGFFVAKQLHASSLSRTFQTAIEQNLSTKTYMKQTMFSPTNFTDTSYDMTNIKKPILSAKTAVNQGAIVGFASEGYSNLNDTYVKFTPKDPTPTQAAAVNKWIVVRKDGFLDKSVDAAALQLYDARTLAFEPLVVGNFNATQQKSILNTIATQKLYQFNASEVSTVEENGQKLLKYPVTMPTAAIAAVGKKAAEQAGYGMTPTFANTKASVKAEFLVDGKTKRVVRIKTTRDTKPVTYFYTNYDMTKVAATPEPEIGWSDYTRLMSR